MFGNILEATCGVLATRVEGVVVFFPPGWLNKGREPSAGLLPNHLQGAWNHGRRETLDRAWLHGARWSAREGFVASQVPNGLDLRRQNTITWPLGLG